MFVTKGGKRIDVEGTVRQRDDGKGTITTDAFFRNISARSELQRMKDELVNLIAHELRTPLTPISTVLELLSDSEFTVTPERMRGLLKTAHRNTEWLVR